MNHLAKAINRAMRKKSRGAATKITSYVGIDYSYFWMIRNGKRKASPQILKRLVKILCKTTKERAELIAAHLKDESCGYWPAHITIEVSNGKSR